MALQFNVTTGDKAWTRERKNRVPRGGGTGLPTKETRQPTKQGGVASVPLEFNEMVAFADDKKGSIVQPPMRKTPIIENKGGGGKAALSDDKRVEEEIP